MVTEKTKQTKKKTRNEVGASINRDVTPGRPAMLNNSAQDVDVSTALEMMMLVPAHRLLHAYYGAA